ncbi:universal stress protein [Tessaracoccus caeni]|uniref:universal stress protein n=1 Tax=Tessaracoccus caeni TaxID=3031239 RepID=UPI0023DA3AE7|nr:universal stress protein [Tessaracoccus caeni]MDF1489115.1 universal stress protein [Tessaracoccus caeni]
MSIVVGVSPAHEAHEGVALATLLARAGGTDMVVVAVVPTPWRGRALQVDRDYLNYLHELAEGTLATIRESLPDDVPCQTVVRTSPSISEGLLAAAKEFDAPLLVLGSSSTGSLGFVALGSVTERLMHSSSVPIAVAPHGYTAPDNRRVPRVSIGFIGGADEAAMVSFAGSVASSVGASVRLVSFAVHSAPPVTSSLGEGTENDVVDTWAAELREIATDLSSTLAGLPHPPEQLPPAFGRGSTWHEALADVDWDWGDVLVVGSSRTMGAIGVFLGGTASKITRHSPVPVIVVPRNSHGR